MKKQLVSICVVLAALTVFQSVAAGQISGELKKWHKVTLTFDGPKTSETADPNPFMDYRLDVTFSHAESGKSYRVPGYFAADGDAANTSADTGNKWRVHFAPSQAGTWKYTVSFRKGKNVAVSEDKSAGESAGFMDGQSGTFTIGPTDKTGRDFRGKGLLQYVGKHHLCFAETGEYFLKCGADTPENFLAYKDFDGDFKADGHKDNLIKDWAPHIKDWRPGDPTWQNGKGKGIIGAVNYLASEGMNVFSFLPMNIAGDDQNVFPYLNYDERLRMDVSRLDQWEIVFEHADKLGMYLHFKTLETENELLLDNGDLGPQRKLYYRELIARFSHHLALNWNLGEEINNASHDQKVAWANYFWTQDPYQHHIVIHNGANHYDLLGSASNVTGFSLQTSPGSVFSGTKNYIDRSAAAGKPWVVAWDETNSPGDGVVTDAEDYWHDSVRAGMWGHIMAGGAGCEYYFGYGHPHSDLTCQDFRSRDHWWDLARFCLQFFKKYEIPFWDMKCEDEMTANTDDYILCKPGEVYLVYLKHGGKVTVDVSEGAFACGWYNPRTGEGIDGLLEQRRIAAKNKAELAAPDDNDWLLVIRGGGTLNLGSDQPPRPPAAAVVPAPKGAIVLEAISHFEIVPGGGFVPAYKDQNHRALAINPDDYKDEFAAAETVFTGKTGTYDITITTIMETDGESTYRLKVADKEIGTFTNPKTSEDYKPTYHTWKNVSLVKGAKIRVEFNSATNSMAGQGDRKAYSRGRWIQLTITGPGKSAAAVASAPASSGHAEAEPTSADALEVAVGVSTVFEERGGIAAVEAEHFAAQTLAAVRRWCVTTTTKSPQVEPDGDPSHADSASGKAYLEVLPDTRRTNSDRLINGQNFSNEPGKMAVLLYKVHFNTPGRYYVWVRAYSTGGEDNGLHVGIDGSWPESGRRLQWCQGKDSWHWESKQRTDKEHCGEPYKIFVDVDKPGLHAITFSMREDGFEFDKWIMTRDRELKSPHDAGPAEVILAKVTAG
jgi:hypothetical protein